MRSWKWFGAVGFLLGACGNADDAGDQVTALFELPSAGMTSEFYALPFPNDLRLDADGSVNLRGHLRPTAGTVETWLDTFDAKTFGFGTNSAIYMRFSGPIDPSSLPTDAAATIADTASVYLVNIDPGSQEYGKKHPLRMRFQEAAGMGIGPNWLACLPYPGFPMRPATRYALIATSRLKGKSGRAVTSSFDFDQVRAHAAAAAVYAPVLEYLDMPGGDSADDVVNATTFRTQDPVSLIGRLRSAVYRQPAPVERGVKNVSDGDDPYLIFTGTYDTPIFQNGEIPYIRTGGEILVDGNGDPIVQQTVSIRFALTVPRSDPPPDGWPIVLYGHGTGGDWRSFIANGTARRLSAEGVAMLSIDQVLHGPRDPTGSDPELTFFNFMNPVAGRDNVRQGAADNFQLLRLAETLTVDDGQRSHHFDKNKIMFMGHSQGGLTGPPFLAYEPKIKAAVLSGAGGLIYVALLQKLEPVSIPDLLELVLRDDNLDEWNPIINLVQMFIEPADPVNYGPLIKMDVYQSEGFIDTFAPIDGIEAFGVSMGLAPVGPVIRAVPGFALRGQTVLSAPVMSNLGTRTGVFLQYNAAPGQDGHYVVTGNDVARRQSAKFLGTAAQGTATLVP